MKRAFTLIELLVVLAVSAVLAALLFPVFARARESARQSACASNQRQLGTAVQLYLQEYDERFPQTHPTATPWTWPDDEITLEAPWRDLMEPYVRAPRIFACPSDPGAPDWHPTSYAPSGYTVYGATLAQFDRPAQTIYLAELRQGTLVDDFSPWLGAQGLDEDLATHRHHEGAVYLFMDGHIRWLRFERAWSPTNMFVPGS